MACPALPGRLADQVVMSGKPPGHIVLGILRHLEEVGEATRAEMMQALDLEKGECGSVVSRLNKKLPTRPKRIYVLRYVYTDDTNGRYYPRAVYALGDGEDARKPKSTRLSIMRRYRERERHRVSSVFQWTQPRRVRQQQRKGASLTVEEKT